MGTHKSSPLFSLVLRTKNEIQNIGNFCEAVCNQTYKNIEFIVVDNFSTDGTAEELSSKQGIRFFSNGPETFEKFQLQNLQKVCKKAQNVQNAAKKCQESCQNAKIAGK